MLVEYWKRVDYKILFMTCQKIGKRKSKFCERVKGELCNIWILQGSNWVGFQENILVFFTTDFEVSKLFRVIDGSYVKWYIQTIKRTEKEQDFDEKRFVLLFILPQTLVRIDLIWDFTFPFVLAVRCPKKFVCNFVVKYIRLFRGPDVM